MKHRKITANDLRVQENRILQELVRSGADERDFLDWAEWVGFGWRLKGLGCRNYMC
jgi:hypothetical protein